MLTHDVKGQDTTKYRVSIEKEVDSVFHSMIKAAEMLDYDKLNQGVNDSHKAGFISNDTYYAAFDSLLNIVKMRSAGLVKQTIFIQQEKMTVLSETIVLLIASGNAKIETNSGDLFDIKFFWSFVYEKINDEWKVIQSHQTVYR